MTYSSMTVGPPWGVSAPHNKVGWLRTLRRRPRYSSLEVRLLGFCVWALLWLLRRSIRFECRGMERLETDWRNGRPAVLASWHGRAIMLPFLYRGPAVYVLNSTHRDGEIISRALARFGIRSTRGSSRRRAVAGMLELFRALARGNDVALIVDGPRGPAGIAKAGAVAIAQHSGAPLYPLAFSASHAIRLPSWDRMMLPLPGARVVCIAGEPLELGPGRASKRARESLRLELEQRLGELSRRADRAVGRPQEDT